MTAKWMTLNSVSVLADRWIDLRADHCRTPSGVDIDPYYVLTYPDWVHIVALTSNDEMVLVRQYRHAAGMVMTELPGGMMDDSDRSIEEAARRELLEETGFSAPNWQLVSSVYPNPATHTNRLHIYLATDARCDRSQSLDRGEEGLVTLVMPIVDVLAAIKSGEIKHAAHVGAVLLSLDIAGQLPLRIL